eukprot:gnl/Chilomastix_caulleri/7041.p1 GENE.gnl/Chilomastix_caulleri/7041~~gnl/Chilomastix_caulleri/7041.p1  ORF type:complete len:86 (+),score=16.30 gnl/Chilomastix_caulleri/7041:86-343(+)
MIYNKIKHLPLISTLLELGDHIEQQFQQFLDEKIIDTAAEPHENIEQHPDFMEVGAELLFNQIKRNRIKEIKEQTKNKNKNNTYS